MCNRSWEPKPKNNTKRNDEKSNNNKRRERFHFIWLCFGIFMVICFWQRRRRERTREGDTFFLLIVILAFRMRNFIQLWFVEFKLLWIKIVLYGSLTVMMMMMMTVIIHTPRFMYTIATHKITRVINAYNKARNDCWSSFRVRIQKFRFFRYTMWLED